MVVPARRAHGGRQARQQVEGALALEGLPDVRQAERVHAAVGDEGRATALRARYRRQNLKLKCIFAKQWKKEQVWPFFGCCIRMEYGFRKTGFTRFLEPDNAKNRF